MKWKNRDKLEKRGKLVYPLNKEYIRKKFYNRSAISKTIIYFIMMISPIYFGIAFFFLGIEYFWSDSVVIGLLCIFFGILLLFISFIVLTDIFSGLILHLKIFENGVLVRNRILLFFHNRKFILFDDIEKIEKNKWYIHKTIIITCNNREKFKLPDFFVGNVEFVYNILTKR